MNTNCYLCESNEYKIIFTENEIPILKCKNCSHVYSSFEQDEHYDGYWGEEGTQEFDLDWWDHGHRKIYSHFINKFIKKDSGTILDVGCGLGFFVKAIKGSKPNWNAIGYEMAEPAVKFAKEKNNLDTVFSGMVQKTKELLPVMMKKILCLPSSEFFTKQDMLYMNTVLEK